MDFHCRVKASEMEKWIFFQIFDAFSASHHIFVSFSAVLMLEITFSAFLENILKEISFLALFIAHSQK